MTNPVLTVLRRLLVVGTVTFFVLVLLLAGLWVSRERSLPALINMTAGSLYGFSIRELQGMEWSPGRLEISRLAVVAEPGRGQLFARGMHINYTLTPFNVDTAYVAGVQIIPFASEADAAPTLSISGLFELVQGLPIHDIQVPTIEIRDTGAVLDFSMSRVEDETHLTLAEADRGITAAIRLLPENVAEFEVSTSGLPGLSFKGELTPADDNFALRVHISGVVSAADALVAEVMVNSRSGDAKLPACDSKVALDLYMSVPDDVARLSTTLAPLQANVVLDVRVMEPLNVADRELLPELKLEGSVAIVSLLNPVLKVVDPGVSLQLVERTTGADARMDINEAVCSFADQRCSLSGDASVAVADASIDSIGIAGLELVLAGTVALDSGGFSLELKERARLAATSINVAESSWLAPELSTNSTVRLRYTGDEGVVVEEPVAGTLQFPRIEHNDLAASAIIAWSEGHVRGLGQRQEHGQGDSASGGLSFETDYLDIQSAATWLPVLTLQGQIDYAADAVSMLGAVLDADGGRLVALKAAHNLPSTSGTLSMDSGRLVFNSPDKNLASRFADWPFDWDLLGGTANVVAEFSWQQTATALEFSGVSEWAMQDIDARYDDLALMGLNTEVQLSHHSLDAFSTQQPMTLAAATLDVGARIENLESSLSFDSRSGAWSVDHASAQMLGGRVSCVGCRRESTAVPAELRVQIDGLDLAEVLALTEYAAVQGTGTLNGDFPFSWGDQGLLMEAGVLTGLEPGGVLKYLPDGDGVAKPTGNESLDLVSQALANYHYEHLEAGASYSPDGELLLKMRIEGFNPDLYDGQRVNLNLNLSDNIPNLLRSLQAGRQVADLIEQQLR